MIPKRITEKEKTLPRKYHNTIKFRTQALKPDCLSEFESCFRPYYESLDNLFNFGVSVLICKMGESLPPCGIAWIN